MLKLRIRRQSTGAKLKWGELAEKVVNQEGVHTVCFAGQEILMYRHKIACLPQSLHIGTKEVGMYMCI